MHKGYLGKEWGKIELSNRKNMHKRLRLSKSMHGLYTARGRVA